MAKRKKAKRKKAKRQRMWFPLTGWVLFDPDAKPRHEKKQRQVPTSPIADDLRRPVGGESPSPEWEAHLERLAARAAEELPIATEGDQ